MPCSTWWPGPPARRDASRGLASAPNFRRRRFTLACWIAAARPSAFAGMRGRTRGDGQPDMCVTFLGEDPNLNADQISHWASAFDVVISTRPVDLKGRASRDFMRRYQDMLLTTAGWGIELLGTVDVATPKGPLAVEVFACRRQ